MPASRPFLLTALGQTSNFSGRVRGFLWSGTSGAGADQMEITDNPASVPSPGTADVLHIGTAGSANYQWWVAYPGPGLHVPYGLQVTKLTSGRVLVVPVDG